MPMIYVPMQSASGALYFEVQDSVTKKVRRTHAFYRSEQAMQDAIKRETRRDLEVAYRTQHSTFSPSEWEKFMKIMTNEGIAGTDKRTFLYDPSDDEKYKKGE